jgi:hypothetical protein
MEPTEWLLSNGEVITEPALEMTSTGRKVRVAGTTDSVYSGELEELLARAANTLAAQRGARVQMELPPNMTEFLRDALGLEVADTNGAKLHLIHDPTNAHAKTIAWWRFKDSSSPLEVLLVAKMEPAHWRDVVQQRVTIWLAVPYAVENRGLLKTPRVSITYSHRFSDVIDNALSRHEKYYTWTEYTRDNPPDWPITHLADTTHSYARPAVTQYLKALQDFEDLDSITVPDLSDPDTPAYKTLELYETNVNAELLSDLAEYLDGAPTIEQVAKLYQEMLDTLRSVGIEVSKKSENDFMAALLAGEKETLNMQVSRLDEENQSVDYGHRLVVHLPSGTFIVECDHVHTDHNQVAEKWEEAMTMASLTGQESELLAYAKEYAKDRIKKRTTKILKERTSST